MSEVFIAYSRSDSDLVNRLRTRLEELDVQVFMDIDIGRQGGEANFIRCLNEQLARAKAVLVLWTAASINNEFVIGEAEKGRNRQVLVPAICGDGVRPLLNAPYNTIQAPDLTRWFADGEPHSDRDWHSLLGMLGGKLERKGLRALALFSFERSRALGLKYIRDFPDDVSCERVKAELEQSEREQFRDRLADVKSKLEARVRDAHDAVRACSGSLGARLEDIRNGRDVSDADPLAELDRHITSFDALAEIGRETSGEWQTRSKVSEEALAAARCRVSELEAEASSAKARVETLMASAGALDGVKSELASRDTEVARLNAELKRVGPFEGQARKQAAELAAVRAAAGQPTAPAVRRRPMVLASALALFIGAGLATGTFVLAGFTRPDMEAIRKRDQDYEMRLASLRQAEDRVQTDREALRKRDQDYELKIASLKQSEEKLQTDLRALADGREQLRRERDDFQRRQDLAARPSPAPAVAPTPVPPPQPTLATLVSRCDDAAAQRFDLDRPRANGWQDSHLAIPEEAIQVCTSAKQASTDTATRRRMMVNLGRAYAGKADRLARAGDVVSAENLFASALAEWTEAANRFGSANAYQLIAAYWRLTFWVRNGETVVFKSPSEIDQMKIWTAYSRSAELGSPIGMINAAYYLSFPDWSGDMTARDDEAARRYLDRARSYDIPFRSFVVGVAELYGRAMYNKDEDDGLGHIGYAACRGDKAAISFFARTKRYKRFEPQPGQCDKLAAAN